MKKQNEVIFDNGIYTPTLQTANDKIIGAYCGGCYFFDNQHCFKLDCQKVSMDYVYKLDLSRTREEKIKRIFDDKS